eukprot:364996-Chlamydomonas_euryale.AAC.5
MAPGAATSGSAGQRPRGWCGEWSCHVDPVALGQLQPYGPPDRQDLRHCRLFSDFEQIVPSFSKRCLLTSFAVFYFWRCRLAHPCCQVASWGCRHARGQY